MDKMLIEDLELEAIIGIHPHERNQKQTLFIDLEITYDSTKAAQHDHIDHALDYERIVTLISDYLDENAFFLLETLVNRLSEYLQHTLDLEKIRLTAYKPSAISNAKRVGISIERQKHSTLFV